MNQDTRKLEEKLQSIEEKCNRLLSLLSNDYVHNDMESLLKAAKHCAERDVERPRMRIVRRN